MLECFDSLNQEIINVQLLDLYFKNNELRTETVFFTEDYLYQNVVKIVTDYIH